MNEIVLTKKQSWTRKIILVIFITLIVLALTAYLGYYFSDEPLKEIGKSGIPFGSEEYDAALADAQAEQRDIFKSFILTGLIVSAAISAIILLLWDRLYKNKKLMSNIYRTTTILVFTALGFAFTYLAHYLVHNFLYENLGWFSYTANRMRINNIIVFIGLFVVPLCIILGLITSYFFVNRFLFPPRDVKSLSYSNEKKTDDES